MAARDYEDPQDADTNNVYAVTVRATDADGNTDDASFTVTVADTTESATLTVGGLSDATVNENVPWTSATPALSGDDPIGDGDVDAGRAMTRRTSDIVAATGVVSMAARDYEDPQDADANNVYAVTVRATDADGNTDDASFTVTAADLVEVADFTVTGLSNVTVNENVAWASATPALSGDDPIGAVTWTLEGDDAGDFSIVSTTGVVSMAARDYEDPQDADADNVYAVTVRGPMRTGTTRRCRSPSRWRTLWRWRTSPSRDCRT